jgi:hypothetical protein
MALKHLRGPAGALVVLEQASNVLQDNPLVASSDLLGYTWASIVRQAMPYPPLAEVNVKELTSPFSSNVLYRKDAHLSPIARRFIEILKATAPEIGKATR